MFGARFVRLRNGLKDLRSERVEKMRSVIAAVIALSSVVGAGAKTVATGWRLVVKVEARATGVPSEQIGRIVAGLLPNTTATVEYVTDGRAVRSTISGGLFGFTDGTVRLAPTDRRPVYVLNPHSRTYYIAGDVPFSGQSRQPGISFKPTDVFRNILGYRVQKVTASYRQTVEVPAASGAGRSEMKEVSAEIENWCTGAVTVPAAMVTMMDLTQRLSSGGALQYRLACPLALESVFSLSVLPDFDFISTTQSISKVSGEPAGAFEIPPGYRQVAPGGGGPSK